MLSNFRGFWTVSLHAWRGRLRLASALVMLTFVVCHLTAHSFLLVSFEDAEMARKILMYPWGTLAGTALLVAVFLVHYSNALWSIYTRRSLHLTRWEWTQLVLGLCIPLVLTFHVVATRIAKTVLDVDTFYTTVFIAQWIIFPWLGAVQVLAVILVWAHACVGIHYWLRTKRWYPNWRPLFFTIGLLLPTLALAGFITGGNQVLREAKNADFVQNSLDDANLTPEATAEIVRMADVGWIICLVLVVLPFAGRGLRGWYYRRRRPPMLAHANGRKIPVLAGATVLETLRANGIAHASVCGGRGRCTTCRILVTKGLDQLAAASDLEAAALSRIGASGGLRLACQIRPTADLSVMPLLAADAGAADGSVRGGLEGSERPITVVFVDGHYSQFTGDGLMALYGLYATDPATGPADAMRGAREMLQRLDQLNYQMRGDLREPLRIGIGIHYSEAIVGAMGPPRSQIITAIGDTVNTCARLESLTKDYGCAVIISRQAAVAAGLPFNGQTLHQAPVKGRTEPVEFYALATLADLPA
jgi:adenylate cyclase